MCEYCMKHGVGKKLFMNAREHSKELAKELDVQEYLAEQSRNFQRVFSRDYSTFGYKLQMPLFGRLIHWNLQRKIQSKGLDPIKAMGMYGQVIPFEEGKIILEDQHLTQDFIALNYCLCRFMHRNKKECLCLLFGLSSDMVKRIKDDTHCFNGQSLDRDKAVKILENNQKKGYHATIYFRLAPHISSLCSCERPVCYPLRLTLDFKFKAVFESSYIAKVDPDACQGCGACVSRCSFEAISQTSPSQPVTVDAETCFGCGVCRYVCDYDALTLVPVEVYPVK